MDLLSLSTQLFNHIQRRFSSTVEVHGLRVADPSEVGTVGAAGKLLKLGAAGEIPSGGGGGGPSIEVVAAAIAQLDLILPRIKKHPTQVATAGQTTFTLPENFVSGTLLVYTGGVYTTDYAEAPPLNIVFNTGRTLGEHVDIVELQLGSNDGTTVVDPGATEYYLVGETPDGVIDSTDGTNGNGVFVVDFPVDSTPYPRVFVSGTLELTEGAMYTRSGQTFTILAPYKPIVGETIKIFYRHL